MRLLNLKKEIFTPFWSGVKLYTQTKAWLLYNRDYSAPLYPTRLYWISPDKIYRFNKEPSAPLSTCVRDGDWDLEADLFSERRVYQSFINYFENGKIWEDTAEFDRLKDEKYNGSREQAFQQLTQYEKLFENIKKNGYKTQRQLAPLKKRLQNPFNLYSICPEWNEVSVSLGRNGSFIWRGNGQHRLSIAKILDLDKIPVRILVRHAEWQNKRDEIWENPESVDSADINHPDLANLIEKRTS